MESRGERGDAPDGRISPPDMEVPTFSAPHHTRPPLTRLPVAWLRPLMALDEEAVVQYSGLDAAVLLRVFDMVRTANTSVAALSALPPFAPACFLAAWFVVGTTSPEVPPHRLVLQGTRLFGVLSLLLPPTLIPVFWTAHAGACAQRTLR